MRKKRKITVSFINPISLFSNENIPRFPININFYNTPYLFLTNIISEGATTAIHLNGAILVKSNVNLNMMARKRREQHVCHRI